MKKYQIQDVNLLVDLYEKLLPWIKHPSVAAHDMIENGCTNCGSTKIQSRGMNATEAGNYRRYQCSDCGAWMRGKSMESRTNMRKL